MTQLLVRSAESLPDDDGWLHPDERARLGSFRFAKRRLDYCLGRWTAKHAVARSLGRDDAPEALASIEIRSDDDGAPEAWIDGVRSALTMSLSHRENAGLCAIVAADRAVGCDVECAEPRSDAFIASFLSPTERTTLASLREPDRSIAATLFWSAKESALKALRIGLDIDTRDVVVTGIEGPRSHHPPIGEPSSWSPIRISCRGAPEALPGWWCARGPWLFTVVADRGHAYPRWVQ